MSTVTLATSQAASPPSPAATASSRAEARAADPEALSPVTAQRLLDELREARDAYLDALRRAYRAGISAHELRAGGAAGREGAHSRG
jgi:hypothetical protein